MSEPETARVTTLAVLYRQEPDALARVLSVLRRLRIHLESISSIPAGDGTARAVLMIQCPAYHAERAQALIGRLVPVLDVAELGAGRAPRAADARIDDSRDETTQKGFDDGYDSV